MTRMALADEALLQDGDRAASRSAWMDIDWTEHQRWVEVAGRCVNVIELGEGPPVVFVHGLSGCWQNWLEQLPHFAREHRVIALDLPGFGASPMPRDPITISGYAAIVDELCDTLGIDAAAIVGNSMGGFIAAELAIRFPQRVERLVLVSAAGISSEHLRRDPLLAAARIVALGAGWAASRNDVIVRRRKLRNRAMAIVARHPERMAAPLAYEFLKGSGKPGFVDALEALMVYPIRDRLPEIACPTLIVWGTHDRVVPFRDAAEFERLITDTRKLVFPDTGHVSMAERPDEFNAALDAFLAE
jgi:pimeloyl-ACP methyl ester carboxylesterase